MARDLTKARVNIANAKSKTKALGVKVLLTSDIRGYGEEPIYDRMLTAKEFNWALTWYSANMDDKTGITFAVQYLNSLGRVDDAKLVKAGGEKYFPTTLGRVAKIILNGGLVPEYALTNFENALEDGKRRYDAAKADIAPKKFKEEPRLNEKNVDLLEPIETAIDNQDMTFDLRDYLAEQEVPKDKATKIVAFYKGYLTKAEKYTEEDADDHVDYLKMVVTEAAEYAGIDATVEKVKKPRKPRKKKVQSAEWLIRSAKISPEFPELKLKSVALKEIVGAKAIWLYDTKYGKLTVLRGEVLSVKGSTVIGFNEDTSLSKRCGRKAALITDNVIKAGKVALRKIFDDIKTAPITFTGRLNENIIFLRVEK